MRHASRRGRSGVKKLDEAAVAAKSVRERCLRPLSSPLLLKGPRASSPGELTNSSSLLSETRKASRSTTSVHQLSISLSRSLLNADMAGSTRPEST